MGDRRDECVLKSRRGAGLMPPVSLWALKGYLLASTTTELWAFNTTGHLRSGPRFILQDTLDNVAMAFGHAPSQCTMFTPKIIGNKQRQVGDYSDFSCASRMGVSVQHKYRSDSLSVHTQNQGERCYFCACALLKGLVLP